MLIQILSVTSEMYTHWLGDAEEIDLFHTIDFML